MRKLMVACVAAVAVAAPAQAANSGADGRELKVTGTVVRASARAVSVESAAGLLLTCAVPERLATTAAAFKAGDGVRMLCVRYRGRPAQLLKLQRSGRAEQREKPESPGKARKASG